MTAASERSRATWLTMETLNSAIQTLAIIGAGAWGIYTFIYEAKIAPGLAPPSVSVTSSLARVGQRGDLVAIRSTVTRTNVGKTEVRVLGLTYNVLGVRMRFPDPPAVARAPADLSGRSAVTEATHYEEAEDGEVLLRAGLLFEGATAAPSEPSALNPGESVSRDLIFYVDATRLDAVRFLVELSYTKMADAPVPLVLETDADQRIAARPGPACRGDPAACRHLVTTDFGTEFSLWTP